MKILLLGQGVLAWQIAQVLLTAEKCQLVGMLRCNSCSEPAANALLKQLLDNSAAVQLTGISTRSASFRSLLNELQPDYVLLACWGEILTRQLLETADTTFINCHPSLLPRHRGPNPYASVLQQQEIQTGVSFHIVDKGIDTGPLLLQQLLNIHTSDDIDSLRHRCAVLAGQMTTRLLKILANPDFQPIPQQQLGEASYYPATASRQIKLSLTGLSSLDRAYP